MDESQLARSVQVRRSEERSEISAAVIKSALTAMAVTFGKELDEMILKSWTRALDDLSKEQIIEGFRRMEKTFIPTAACPFPVPAHLRAHVDAAKENATQVSAEDAWEKSMEWVRRFYRPDCRNMTRPKLTHMLWRSLCVAGGPDHVSECSMDELAWAKKRFIEAYLSLEQLKEDENFIGRSEAREILNSIGSGNQLEQFLKGKSF